MVRLEQQNRPFKRRGLARRAALSAAAMLAFLAFAVATPVVAGDTQAPSSLSIESGGVKSLQLGLGRSVIVDLSEDATEIFVGEPKVANAIVRSARRLYISTLAPGQTTIFALGANGRKIAVLEISVGRDVGELSRLLKAAIPDNDIHVRTVADSIILTGSVASAGDAQKALDIASGFLASSQASTAGGSSTAGGGATAGGSSTTSINQNISIFTFKRHT
jgi:pilus assembly protein CpaC